MKKLIFIASSLLVALSGCGGNTGGNTPATADSLAAALPPREASGAIAYVRIDSLMNGYDMYNELNAQFEQKAKVLENDLSGRARSLERAVADAQNKIEKGLVTRAEAASLQESLQRQEQSLYQYSETRQGELAEENQVMTNKISYSIEEFMKEYNADYRYSVILTTTSILHADPMLDITAEVLAGLNARYAREKTAK